MAYSSLCLVGNEEFRRLNLDYNEVRTVITRLRDQGFLVTCFGKDGWDCEIEGTQVFRATALDASSRFHVRLNSRLFPDI